MSSPFNYSSQSDEDLELNYPQPTNTNNHLSPFNHSQTLSNSTSPYNIDSTPGESLSEFSNYQPSELSDAEDPFFGVNFDAGVPRVDSIPTAAIHGNVAYRSANLNRPLPPAPPQENKSPSTATAASAYPLSPIHSSKPSTPSPKRTPNEPQGTISPQELISGLQNSQFPSLHSATSTHTAVLQLTPDHSGSSHTSAEGVKPSTMPRYERSPQLTTSKWGSVPQSQLSQSTEQYSSTNGPNFGGMFPTHANEQTGRSSIIRDEDGSWRSNDATGQAGLDPGSRRELADAEVPTLKEQEERRRIADKNVEVHEWRSAAGGSDVGDEGSSHPSILLNPPGWHQPSHTSQPDDDDGINPTDDTVSIHENRFLDGQVYVNVDATHISEYDINLLKQPRHWSDAPALPYSTDTTFQPGTAQEAIQRFLRQADSISIASRAATWGTRRRSEPSLKDFDGSFLKKLSISKSNDRPRQGSLLDGLANIVRKRSDSKLKRTRSTQNIPEESESPNNPRKSSQGTLIPPHRTSSFGKKHPTPHVNTASAFAAMAGPLAAVGATHARKGSVSVSNTSPKSPIHLGIPSVFSRSRSKSDVSNTALSELWRNQGGPPVAKLAGQKSQAESNRPEAQQDDADDEDEEDDEQADENDMAGSDQSAQPIIPNYEGFKAHVRRLNPDMSPHVNWLVSRVAHQQEIRYKNLLDLRVKHSQALLQRNCASGPHCLSLNGHIASDVNVSKSRNGSTSQDFAGGLQLVTDFSDGSNPGEGALTDETFPQGVPMPPTRNLPDEFECQLCFKVKKFQKPSDWTKHVHEDVQPFTCTYEKCKEPKSFKRKADWVRHENERHRHLEWWICQVDDCRHPCYRKDNFLQHLVREHKLPEPKQKTKAAIKKARLTEPAWVLLEQCHHETQKRPQDEPCKFCGKCFPTWKKLTVHLAKHMEHISLPVLHLVESKIVDANTIISPVEQILTPVTPIGRPKMESTSPFDMGGVSPHMPAHNSFATTGYEQQPTYFQTTGPTGGYDIQTQMTQGNYVNDIYPNTFQPMNQPRGFQPLNSNTMGHMDQPRGFDTMHSTFHPKIEQQDFEPLDTGFSHMQNQQNFNTNQNSPYSVPQPFSGAPAVSNFQTPNILGINDVGYGFEPMAVNPSQGYPQVPMTRAQGSASSYGTGHSPQQNVTFYQ